MNNKSKGFVLSIHEYREHDGFIRFLSEDYGLLNFILPGYYRAKSKQGRLGIEFTYVEYQFNYRQNSLNRIIGGQLLDGYFDLREDYDWLVDMSLTSEIITKMYQEEHHKFYYRSFETMLRSDSRSKLLARLLMDISRLHGFAPYLEACIICDSPGINSFSIRDGGFLCTHHSRKKDNKDILILLYSLFLGKDVEVDEEIRLKVIDLLVNYLAYHAEIKINSWKLKSSV